VPVSPDREAAPSRRRGDRLVDALLTATLDELAEVGYPALTMAGVAARAGTSKPVLYRRWPTRAHVVLAALVHAHRQVGEAPITGSLREDLIGLLGRFSQQAERIRPDVVWGLLAESATRPDLYDAVRHALTDGAATSAVEKLVELARRRGEISRHPLTADQLELPLTLARQRLLLAEPLDRETIESIIDEIVLPVYRSAGSKAPTIT
jgi:AcrR family transcriptional regulator